MAVKKRVNLLVFMQAVDQNLGNRIRDPSWRIPCQDGSEVTWSDVIEAKRSEIIVAGESS